LHQETSLVLLGETKTSHGGGGAWVYNCLFLPKMGVATKCDKTKSYYLRNAMKHFLTIGDILTMSLCPRWYRQPYWLIY
jgi:hypothetical protein